MNYFETFLLRERFVIHNLNDKSYAKPMVALSNRIVCDLTTPKGKIIERFVVRGHNMHSCLRMAARLIKSYRTGGPILSRTISFDWEDAWKPVLNDYERKFNPHRWIAVYYEGKVIFEVGERHPFFDLIEKCELKNKGAYEDSIGVAEGLFKKTGKNVRIDYDGNVAFVIKTEDDTVRNGIILRDANRTTTFTFSVSPPKPDKPVNLAQCLSVAAAHLEAIQMCFFIGMHSAKEKRGMIDRTSDEAKKGREARQRLARLNTEISNLETGFVVHYRPERPNFTSMVDNAEALTKAMLDKEQPE